MSTSHLSNTLHSSAAPTNVVPTGRSGVDIGAATVAELRSSYQGMASTHRDIKSLNHVHVANLSEVKLLLASTR